MRPQRSFLLSSFTIALFVQSAFRQYWPRADNNDVSASHPHRTVYFDRPLWRHVGTWPRRDSFLLGGLLLLVAYLAGAVAVFGEMGVLVDVVFAGWAIVIGVAAIAEFRFGLNPTQARLARADRLALLAFCVWFGVSLVAVPVALLG